MGKRRLKERRTIIVRLYTLLIILGLAVLFGGATYGIWRAEVRVQNIAISGLEVLHPHIVGGRAEAFLAGSYFYIFPRDSIFLLPTEKVQENLLLEFPRLETVEVQKTGFTNIELLVSERDAAYMWCGESTSTPCFLADGNGFLFAEEQADLVLVQGSLVNDGVPLANTVFKEGALTSVGALVSSLKEVEVGVTKIQFTEPDEVGLTLSQGPVLIYVLGEEGLIAEAFPSVLDGIEDLSEIEYIDMRFGKRVYVKRNE